MTNYRADWIFTGNGPPVRDGVIEVVNNVVVSVKPWAQHHKIDVDLGHSLITPGFKNAHVHLDLGALQGKLAPPTSFTDWLLQVIQYRRQNNLIEWDHAIRDGIAASLRAGTTQLGDISVGGCSAPVLSASAIDAEVFLELIGLGDSRLQPTLDQAAEWLTLNSAKPIRALSPHAPYTVSHQLLQALGERYFGTPIAMHVAETREELDLLATENGPFRPFLEAVGAWHPQNLVGSIDELLELLSTFDEVLLVHGNYLTREQWQHLPQETCVVYCPRTHAYFGHSPHPYLQMLADGVTVLLGTDSLASNPDLSILNECRFLWKRDRHLLQGESVLQLGTGGVILSRGSPATFAVIPYETDVIDPWEALFAGTASPSCVCTYGNLSRFSRLFF